MLTSTTVRGIVKSKSFCIGHYYLVSLISLCNGLFSFNISKAGLCDKTD